MTTQIERTACQILSDNLAWLALPEARDYAERVVSDEEFSEFPGDWYDAAIDHAWDPAEHSVPQRAVRLYRGLLEAYALLAAAVAAYRRHGRPMEDVASSANPETALSMVSSLADDIARCHSMVLGAFLQELPSSEFAPARP